MMGWIKNHTCDEGGAHFRISFCQLLINLKHNYLLRKLLKWTNKKCKNFNIHIAIKKPGDIIILHL